MKTEMMKLSEFARVSGISDRHARRLLADNMEGLAGHYEKRGNKGTWIDREAADYLRQLLRNPMEIHPAAPTVSIEDLQAQVNDLLKQNAALAARWADAERRAGESVAAVALLEAANIRTKELEEGNTSLTAQNAVLSVEIDEARAEAQKAKDEAQNERERVITWKEYRERKKAAKRKNK